MKEKREVKYYRIRSSVVWLVVAVVIGVSIALILEGMRGVAYERTGTEEKNQTHHIEYGNIASELDNAQEFPHR